MTYEQLTGLLATTKEQIRAFDTKAQVLLGVNGVLVGFITAEATKAVEYGSNGLPKRLLAICILLGFAFLTSCVSMGFALFVVHPQLRLDQPTSKVFFCDLARDYGRDYARAAQALLNMQDAEAAFDVGTQIQANAIICDVKSKRCFAGTWCIGLALAAYALTLPIFCSMAYSVAIHPHNF